MSRPFLRLAVIGDPVAHSQSPAIHTEFLDQFELDGSYEAIRVPATQVAERLAELYAAGYVGLNVTTPLKEAVLASLVSRDQFVREVGAANTLIATPRGWHGANTDGLGLVASVCAVVGNFVGSELSLAGQRILILGAGPTARAASVAARDAGARVLIWNRTATRAETLAKRHNFRVWQPGDQVNLAVSTLPPNAELPLEIHALLERCAHVIDANYGPRATLAQVIGRPVIDGAGMLLAQAKLSFKRWLAATEDYPRFFEDRR